MITEQDMYFHPPTSDDTTWAETNYFGFYVPEENIHVQAYVQTKPTLGAVLSSITIVDGIGDKPHEILFSDCYMHLPMPKGNLDDYQLDNGLAIKCTKPVMDYHLRYDGGQKVSFDVNYTGLMEPYDIHDPDMDPLAAANISGDTVSNHAYAGHWDQSGRVQGELEIYGKKYAIDCVSSMDHSWGLRGERQLKNFCWLNANFDNDTSIHCIYLVDPNKLDQYPSIVHGYVREGNSVYGLKAGSGKIQRDGFLHKAFELEVEDVRGKVHRFTGTPLTSNPWLAWPQMYLSHSFCRWDLNGVTGYGEVQDLCKEDINQKLPK
ncbi:MAG: hypothetical protein KBT63_03040 [Porticoccaceae bacterium]|nr:hypothetical protein [Porticoccaceae bacterium]